MKFKPGDRVVVDSENWEYMNQWNRGAQKTTGTVRFRTPAGWVQVDFDNGYHNAYRDVDLAPLSSLSAMLTTKALDPDFSLDEIQLAEKLVNAGGWGE